MASICLLRARDLDESVSKTETKCNYEELSQVDAEARQEKVKYPKSVFFIVSNEFCERFSYYGMRTILSIYLTDMLLFSEPDAKIIYHTFTMFVYFFPLFGAMLADSFLGKFRTIFYISIIYAIGNIVLSLAATPSLHIPGTAFSMIGLLLIALGTGGIKPCVSAFGGDQFILPQQEKQLAAFFSMFYFAINFGSFVSTFLTPILRDQKCFGSEQCFTLAFGVPGVLMVISIVIFVAGKNLYIIREPAGNMVIKVSRCIGNAISTKSKSVEKKDHWLDYAEPKYGSKLVEDIKALLRVLVLYIPLPVFWALFDQQGTGWTFQARRMNGDIGFYTILPDQMQVVNPILILIFIPLFEYAIYPVLNKLNLLTSPLQRLVCGGLLAAVSFAISAGIAIIIEAESPVLPEAGSGHLMLYNNFNCKVTVNAVGLLKEPFEIPELGYRQFIEELEGTKELPYSITGSCLPATKTGKFNLTEKLNMGYQLGYDIPFSDDLAKDDKGFPRISILLDTNPNDFVNITVLDSDGASVLTTNTTDRGRRHSITKPADYTIKIQDWTSEPINLKLGAVYTVVVHRKTSSDMVLGFNEVTEANQLNMLWIVPQYVVITMGEVMFSITGLEFSYSQSPISMKSVLQACWLLTTAFGNLIVVIIESAEFFEKQSLNFFLYAALMVVDMLIFSLMAMRYKYVEKPKEEDEDSLAMEPEKPNGITNVAFNEKEP